MKILIVEDNEILSQNIATYLKLENIQSKQLFEGGQVNYELTMNNYDLVILDLGLPDIDGLDICKKIRGSEKNIPILMLTARNTTQDKISGFQSGSDDYLTKPFDYEELLMRIHALIRRNFTVKSNKINIGDIELNIADKKVSLQGEEVHLSNLEIDLIIYLVQNKGKVISKEELLEKVWGEYDAYSMSRTVDVYIGYLRKKLGKDLIETIRGQGYLIR
ncbi:response regulator transcription factor [Candidatus Gracilibacteria bacterium 28_42_T64]|nr:response regulator transcription factor [Candidatus Gracilibacteria bacterium 28_42_T64]